MLPTAYYELPPQVSTMQSQSGAFNQSDSSLQPPPPPFPPDTHTPVSEQFDDITYPGSEVTVIHRVPSQGLASYWRQDPSSAFLLQREAGGGRFENESSSTTLSCADSYQAQQISCCNGGVLYENGLKPAIAEADEDTTLGANSQRSIPASFSDKNNHCRRRRSSDGESGRYMLDRHRKKSHKHSSHCLSEGEMDSISGRGGRHKRQRWNRRRIDDHQRSARNRSPSCDCDYSHRSSWAHAFDHSHARSLPSVKKHWYGDPNSSPKMRRKKPITGMFGANLAASREEEEWSDSEQIRARTINPNYCGLLGLSCICVMAVVCLFSPVVMLLIPIFLSVDQDGLPVLPFSSKLSIFQVCNVRCEADLLSIAVKTFLLSLTTWKLFIQPITCVCCRLRLRPLSVSALLNRKFRAIDCFSLDFSPFDPTTLHPYPSTERLIGLTLSINFLAVGATCAFWVAFAARWMHWLLRPKPEHLTAVSQDLHVQFGVPAAVDPAPVALPDPSTNNPSYANLINFVLTFTDTLLLLHLVAVTLRTWNYINGNGRHYVVHVVRSPDGASKSFRVTGASLETVASQIIQMYNVEFPLYDAQVASARYRYLRQSPASPTNDTSCSHSRRASVRLRQKLASFSCLTQEEQEFQMKRCSGAGGGGGSSFKFYTLDGPEGTSTAAESLTTLKGCGHSDASGGGDTTRNISALCADRYRSEVEFDRALKKRRMRLLLATEKVFAGVQALSPEAIHVPGCSGPVPPRQAAQLMFPKIIVPLQKYLRLTRLQHLHPPDAILSRLAVCLAHSSSPEAFLSVFRIEEPSSSIYAAFLAPRLSPGLGGGVGSPSADCGCCYGLPSPACVQLAQSWCLHLSDADNRASTHPQTDRKSSAAASAAMYVLKPGTRFHLSRAGVTLYCYIQLEPLLSIKRVQMVLGHKVVQEL